MDLTKAEKFIKEKYKKDPWEPEAYTYSHSEMTKNMAEYSKELSERVERLGKDSLDLFKMYETKFSESKSNQYSLSMASYTNEDQDWHRAKVEAYEEMLKDYAIMKNEFENLLKKSN